MVRRTRADDDEDIEPDEESEAELEAAVKRRPKITRPAFSSFKTTTEKPEAADVTEKVETPKAETAVTGNAAATPSVDAAPRSFVEPAPLAPKVSTIPSFLVSPNRQSTSRLTYQTYQGPQWGGIKGGSGSKGASVKGTGSSFGSGKGNVGVKGGQQVEQAFAKSPIARGKYMYRPRPQVPMVLAPLPRVDLNVPENNGERPQPQQRQYSRYQGPSSIPSQVNSIRQKQYEQPAPVYVQQPAQPLEAAPVIPIARGSRPRSSKSKYVDDQYQQEQKTVQLSPPSPSKSLARAEVSELGPQVSGGSGGYAFTLDDCPYGMRISMCRKRAAERFRS